MNNKRVNWFHATLFTARHHFSHDFLYFSCATTLFLYIIFHQSITNLENICKVPRRMPALESRCRYSTSASDLATIASMSWLLAMHCNCCAMAVGYWSVGWESTSVSTVLLMLPCYLHLHSMDFHRFHRLGYKMELPFFTCFFSVNFLIIVNFFNFLNFFRFFSKIRTFLTFFYVFFSSLFNFLTTHGRTIFHVWIVRDLQ